MSFDVIGGDFPKGGGYFGSQSLTLPAGSWGKKQDVPISLLQSVELVSQETINHKAHKLGKGLAGAAVFGPLGLAFGALAEGKSSSMASFVVQFADGRSFLATSDHKTFLKIKAASLGPNHSRSLPIVADEPSYPMPGLDQARAAYAALISGEEDSPSPVISIDAIRQTFEKHGWETKPEDEIDFIPAFLTAPPNMEHLRCLVVIFNEHIDETNLPDEILRLISTYREIYTIYTVVPSYTDKPFVSVEDSINGPILLLQPDDLEQFLDGF